jgi:uncharacterized protein YceH (UPF0502 family)
MENDLILSPLEARILGCLIEKKLATPDHYPLTLSALVAACTQKSNRDPVMELETAVVEKTLDILRREKKLTTRVHEAGARVPKFEHEMGSHFGLSEIECAVLAELMLRGPQTVAELRNRVPRMVPTLSDNQVETALQTLENIAGIPMVVLLPKAPGRREARYAHLLCGDITETAERRASVVIEAPVSNEEKRISVLEERVSALEVRLENALKILEDLQ